MAGFMQIKGIVKSTPNLLHKVKKDNFNEVFQSTEELLSGKNDIEENLPNPDLTINLKSLSSIYLDSNPKFIELKKKLELYYLDMRREKPRLHPYRSAQWRKLLYSSLHKLLNECLFTQTRSLQIQYLNKVYDWYMEKIGVENRVQAVAPLEIITANDKLPDNESQDLMPEINSPNFDKLSHYSRRQISSAQSLRPQTAPIESLKWLESRPSSAFKPPVLAYTGFSDPIIPKPQGFRSSFVSYQPIGEEAEYQMEMRYHNFRQKDLEEKRLRDEMSQKVQEWTAAKTRRNEEQMRRTESFRFASRFEQRAFLPSRPQTASSDLLGKTSVIDLSQHDIPNETIQIQDNVLPLIEESVPMHKMNRVSSLRKFQGKLIDTEETNEALLIQDPSATILSAYSQMNSGFHSTKNETSMRPSTGNRPSTANSLSVPRSASLKVISSGSRPVTASMAKQVEELHEVKRRLASYNISCSIDDMRYALLSPEDLPPDQLTLKSFPKPGAGLLFNPFIKIGGKKTKKKSKKGKKGKKSK